MHGVERGLSNLVEVVAGNELPDATTVHWHGLRVPNAHDGTHVSQMLVPPGGDFTYDFAVEDAGLFWYHPHGDVQVERGLYAPIRIRGGVEPVVAADRVLVLDDVKVEATGALSDSVDSLDIMLGRQGNVLLVNGRRDARFTATAGSRERWRVVNAANGRYFNVELPGHTLRVIGWDGGLIPEPWLGWKDTVNVPREDTVRIAVQFGAEGRWMYHCHILEHAERGMMGELVVSP
jgi:FtsP/CotA-like multicopper oxidase with cupredoxin domain